MPKKSWLFWLAAFLTAWLADVLGWGHVPGINFPIWICIVLTAGIVVGRAEGFWPDRKSWILVGLAVALAFISFWRREPLTVALCILMSFAAVMLFAATFRNGYWVYYRLRHYFISFFQLIIAALVRPASLKAPAEIGPEGKRIRSNVVAPILRGLVIAIPILLVLTALLASADMVFSQSLTALFQIEKLPEYVVRLFFILCLGWLLVGAFAHAVHPQKEEANPEDQPQSWSPFLGSVETTVVLSLVNLLFLAFVIIQFQYLFGAQSNINAAGFTYSEYARRGFSELVTVAILSIALYLGLASITRRESKLEQRTFMVLSVILLGLVGLILASSYQRLMLYEDAYGFSRLRTYTHFFIAWLAALLVVTMSLELLKRRHRFGLALFVFCFGYVITLGVMNVDGFIAQQNILRARNGGDISGGGEVSRLDVTYFAELSNDAVPVMVEEFRAGSLPKEAQDQLGAELACRTTIFNQQDPTDWQSFNLSDAIAGQLLNANASLWDEYETFTDHDGFLSVKGNGVTRMCNLDMWD